MQLNAAPQNAIVAKMKATYPGEPEINGSNLTRHYKNHLITKPIKVTDATGIEGYLDGHTVSRDLSFDRAIIPAADQRITLPDALAVIIQAGIRNIALNPDIVTPKELMAAMDMARKLGLGGKDSEEFAAAWQALDRSKNKTKRKTTVTVEETVEVTAQKPTGDVIDAE